MREELQKTRQRIREDAQRAPRAWRALFEPLAERIFDRELKLRALRLSCGVASREHSVSFRESFGCDFGEYVTHHRLETGRRLLAVADLKIWDVAREVGFATASSFATAFRRLEGLSPTAWRERQDRGVVPPSEKPAEVRDENAELRRLLLLGGRERDAQREVEELQNLIEPRKRQGMRVSTPDDHPL